jgi:predicted DNA binding protein
MSVIVELRIPGGDFELGRILELRQGATITLETMVPMGEKTVPFFTVHNDARQGFERNVRDHPSVTRLSEVSSNGEETLFALDWEASRDILLEGLHTTQAQVLKATATPREWHFEFRFPSHEQLGEFQAYCEDAHISLEVDRIYNPTKPGAGPYFGLSQPQRETLMRAFEAGYYSIPRTISTQALADEFDISDQAVTERLRRAILTLVENTLVAADEAEDSAQN